MRRLVELVIYGSVIYALVRVEIRILGESSPHSPIAMPTLVASIANDFFLALTVLGVIVAVGHWLRATLKRRYRSTSEQGRILSAHSQVPISDEHQGSLRTEEIQDA
ncbi:hypothetical protein PAN31117_05070 [Pandoraea anapnoica]|uniref:Uncharacterized protein n=1 Tax=Pandoraea anapnoica TaxID=2508301 RepID=A0A5E5APR4_9BURK|nr:hypothetical protein PIN31009_05330 [Pandoraea iniqua]VVE75056.1 hypothetical protein PAN31117_05070 [Pandoraea anapnoica]